MAAARVWTTPEICAEVMRRYNLGNINQLADKFGVAFNTCRNWMRGGTMDAAQIRTAATLLEEDPEWIAFCLAPERLKDASLASQMRAWLVQHGTAALLVLAVFSAFSGGSAQAAHTATVAGIAPAICILCKTLERLRRAAGNFRASPRPRFQPLPPVGNLAAC